MYTVITHKQKNILLYQTATITVNRLSSKTQWLQHEKYCCETLNLCMLLSSQNQKITSLNDVNNSRDISADVWQNPGYVDSITSRKTKTILDTTLLSVRAVKPEVLQYALS